MGSWVVLPTRWGSRRPPPGFRQGGQYFIFLLIDRQFVGMHKDTIHETIVLFHRSEPGPSFRFRRPRARAILAADEPPSTDDYLVIVLAFFGIAIGRLPAWP
jgi:hypothetical protein